MATTYQSHQPTHFDYEIFKTRASLWTVPIGRCLFSLIFIFAGLGHFSPNTLNYATAQGVPMAGLFVPLSGVIAIVGGLSVLSGFKARWGALLIILFLIPVTILMHNFWSVSEPQMAQMQLIHFLKNLSMLGGAILIVFYGAGPKSFDHWKSKNHHQ